MYVCWVHCPCGHDISIVTWFYDPITCGNCGRVWQVRIENGDSETATVQPVKYRFIDIEEEMFILPS
jgi:hypothetical protein